jgi:hypothetical protein
MKGGARLGNVELPTFRTRIRVVDYTSSAESRLRFKTSEMAPKSEQSQI